jgi:MFS family permease
MSYLRLLRKEPRALAFGFAFTFGSSPGQTFFISIFVPSIVASLSIDAEQLGYLYGAATLLSAMLLPFAGRLIDKVDLLHYGTGCGLLLFVACMGMSASSGVLLLFLSLVALRLFGQGLMTHTAMTAMARYFHGNRGKALSLASMGHAAGEALLPLSVLALIAAVGWRYALIASGLVLGMIVSLAVSYQVRHMTRFRSGGGSPAGPESAGTPVPVWRMPAFWIFAPSMVAPSFTVTALVFHQGLLAAELGLPMTAFATGFVFFALMQIPGGMLGGQWTDRFTARALMPWHLLPAIAGIAILAAVGTSWSVMIYLALVGFTSGWSNVVRSAVIAEIVPATNIGSARSIATSAMVLATAGGPAIVGFLHSAGLSAREILGAAMLFLAISSAIACGGRYLGAPSAMSRQNRPARE